MNREQYAAQFRDERAKLENRQSEISRVSGEIRGALEDVYQSSSVMKKSKKVKYQENPLDDTTMENLGFLYSEIRNSLPHTQVPGQEDPYRNTSYFEDSQNGRNLRSAVASELRDLFRDGHLNIELQNNRRQWTDLKDVLGRMAQAVDRLYPEHHPATDEDYARDYYDLHMRKQMTESLNQVMDVCPELPQRLWPDWNTMRTAESAGISEACEEDAYNHDYSAMTFQDADAIHYQVLMRVVREQMNDKSLAYGPYRRDWLKDTLEHDRKGQCVADALKEMGDPAAEGFYEDTLREYLANPQEKQVPFYVAYSDNRIELKPTDDFLDRLQQNSLLFRASQRLREQEDKFPLDGIRESLDRVMELTQMHTQARTASGPVTKNRQPSEEGLSELKAAYDTLGLACREYLNQEKGENAGKTEGQRVAEFILGIQEHDAEALSEIQPNGPELACVSWMQAIRMARNNTRVERINREQTAQAVQENNEQAVRQGTETRDERLTRWLDVGGKLERMSEICDRDFYGLRSVEREDFSGRQFGSGQYAQQILLPGLEDAGRRARLGMMYFLSQGYTADDFFNPDMYRERARAGRELRDLLADDPEPVLASLVKNTAEYAPVKGNLADNETLAANMFVLQVSTDFMRDCTDYWKDEIEREDSHILEETAQILKDREQTLQAAQRTAEYIKNNREEGLEQYLFDQAVRQYYAERPQDGPSLDLDRDFEANDSEAAYDALEEAVVDFAGPDEEARERARNDWRNDRGAVSDVMYEYFGAGSRTGLPVEVDPAQPLDEQTGRMQVKLKLTEDFRARMEENQRLPKLYESLEQSGKGTFHRNSAAYNQVLQCLEKVNRLTKIEKGTDAEGEISRMAVDPKNLKDIREAYSELGTACSQYLKGKTENNRFTALGKERVSMVMELSRIQKQEERALLSVKEEDISGTATWRGVINDGTRKLARQETAAREREETQPTRRQTSYEALRESQRQAVQGRTEGAARHRQAREAAAASSSPSRGRTRG